jgi:hypothetical protein
VELLASISKSSAVTTLKDRIGVRIQFFYLLMTNISQITHLNKSLPDTSGSVASNGMPFTCRKTEKTKKEDRRNSNVLYTNSSSLSASRILICHFFLRIRILPFYAKSMSYILQFIHSKNIGNLFTETYKMLWKLQYSIPNPCSSTFNTIKTDF